MIPHQAYMPPFACREDKQACMFIHCELNSHSHFAICLAAFLSCHTLNNVNFIGTNNEADTFNFFLQRGIRIDFIHAWKRFQFQAHSPPTSINMKGTPIKSIINKNNNCSLFPSESAWLITSSKTFVPFHCQFLREFLRNTKTDNAATVCFATEINFTTKRALL